MYDLRETKTIDLDEALCLKEDTTYKFIDPVTSRTLIAKFISYYDDTDDVYLITEFKKLALLSGEPEIGTVYYLTSSNLLGNVKNCYIMEFIEGDTLKSFLDKRENIIFEVAFDLLNQLAKGLEKSHNYGISHSDLHNENILIDNYGFLKIIDFLWWDNNLDLEFNKSKDLEDFKEICKTLYNKCRDSDKKQFRFLNDFCSGITTFKGLSKELEKLEELSLEFSLLNENSIKILSKLIQSTNGIQNLELALEGLDEDIPEKYDSPINSTEREYLRQMEQKNGRLALQYSDSRIERIEKNLSDQFHTKLYDLKQINLIEWKIWISNQGKTFTGPYKLNARIWFTSKFFKWKRTFEIMPLLPEFEEDLLNNLILE